ncbi:hypothetical protein GCM10011571_22460 [Marinithermofilum abyssi]|uniref:Bacillithiol system protein YtxJ n=1 Tax=Marinithermofilum abyssi TaxID=1571185 RepID=A0A8J2VC35_9BACL|nr:bacillithiol system redox-active protein YtxJ [Marinithermofilum abyssi]GGE20020.1 hypothetical protein GCM10011571_22460 [Marinithermofilum abyssi]
MAQWRELTSLQDWKEVLEQSGDRPVLVFKHSTQCPVSAKAWEESQAYTNGEPRQDVSYVWVKVIEHRDVSNQIAQDLDVRHQSPQAILIKNGQQVWNTSHWHIKQEVLKDVLEQQ